MEIRTPVQYIVYALDADAFDAALCALEGRAIEVASAPATNSNDALQFACENLGIEIEDGQCVFALPVDHLREYRDYLRDNRLLLEKRILDQKSDSNGDLP